MFICLFVIDVFVVGFVGGVKFCDCWDKLGFCWTVIILIGIVVVKVVGVRNIRLFSDKGMEN